MASEKERECGKKELVTVINIREGIKMIRNGAMVNLLGRVETTIKVVMKEM
jgi:hypothetical protein